MSKMTKMIGMSALGLGIAVTIPVLAHEAGTATHCPGHNMRSGMMPMAMMHSEFNVEEHLGKLKESLQLTDAQQPAWERFEQAVKTAAANKPAGHARGNHTPGSDIEAHFAQMEQRMTQMKTVFEARKALFETLTEDQKAAIDNLMPGPFGHHG